MSPWCPDSRDGSSIIRDKIQETDWRGKINSLLRHDDIWYGGINERSSNTRLELKKEVKAKDTDLGVINIEIIKQIE